MTSKRSLTLLSIVAGLAALFVLLLTMSRTNPAPAGSEVTAPDPEGDRANAALATAEAAKADAAAAAGGTREALAPGQVRPTGVRGRVLDSKTLKPLAGVEVVAMRDLPGFERMVSRFRGMFREGFWKDVDQPVQVLGSAVSGPDGVFEILGLPAGRVFLDGRSERHFVRTPGTARLALGEIHEGVELLGAAGGRIRGVVTGPDGLPMSGVGIDVRPGLNAFLGQITQRKYRWLVGTSDAEGKFEIPGVPAGNGYVLSASDRRVALEEVTGVAVAEGQTTHVSVQTRAGALVSGRVVDGDGKPVAGANVAMVYLDLTRLLFSASGRDEPITTGADGQFEIPHVASGRVAFIAAAENLAPSGIEELTVVDDGRYENLLLTLGEGKHFSGLVVDEQDRPLEGVTVEIQPMERPNDPDVLKTALKIRKVTLKTSADGRFETRGMTGERLFVAAMKSGYVSEMRFGVKLDDRDIRMQLVHGATVTGKVVLAGGEPVSRFRVETRSRPDEQAARPAEAANATSRPTGREARNDSSRDAGRRGGEFRMAFGREPRGSFQMRDGQRLLDQSPEGNWEDFISADGTFSVRGVPPGKVTVRVRAEGYADPARQELTLQPGATSAPLVFELKPAAVALGMVVDAVSGQPIPEAQVTAYRARDGRGNAEDGPPGGGMPFRLNIDPEDFDFLALSSADGRRSVLTDSKGRFELGGLSPGRYRFTARHPDLAKASATDVEIRDDRPNDEVVIKLGAGGGIEGLVTGAGKRPLADAIVVALSVSAGAFKSVTTDANGFYRLDGLAPGAYLVFKSRLEERAMNIGFDLLGNMRLKNVTVRDGKLSHLDIHDETEDGVRVYGMVRDGTTAVSRAMVTALSSDKDGIFGIGIRAKPSDPQGNYELVGLKPGTYFFQVTRFDQQPEQAALSIEVPAGLREIRIDLDLPQSYVAGTVVDGEGQPVAGIVVNAGVVEGGAAQADGLLGLILKNGLAQARTAEDGTFKIKRLTAGVYRLTASPRGRGRGRDENTRKYGDALLEDVRVDGKLPVDGLTLRLPLAGSITGLVVDGNNAPLPGAEVHFERDRREAKVDDPGRALADLFGVQLQPARSGPDGRFTIEGVTPGTYRVRADAKGLAPGVADDVLVAGGRPSEVTLRAIKGATLRVRVTNIDGTKLPLANVTVLDGKGKSIVSRVSVLSVFRSVMGDETKKDDSGWRELGNVPPDTYTIIVREKGKPDLSFQRTIKDGEVAEWDLDMVEELKKQGR